MSDDAIVAALRALADESVALGYQEIPMRGDGLTQVISGDRRMTFETAFIHGEGRALLRSRRIHFGDGGTRGSVVTTREILIHRGDEDEVADAIRQLRAITRRFLAIRA